ncbi:MAG: glycosyltransferase family 8 protein, partial [Collinsella sp.]|nr:glycosyltransferase family 8 protein [Collinsella sp.]
NNPHISIETYYRFLIQDVLPAYDKVLYLDSDLVILDDIAKLFNVELANNLVAATRDIDYAGNLNMTDGKRRDYSETVLHLRQPFDYFQAGVLVLNLAEMRKLHSLDEWLALATDSQFIYDDQDILNSECQGRVFYLDQAWNVMTDCDGRIRKVFSFAPAEMFDAFMTAYADPKIVHYAGYEKPWNCVTCDKPEHYWKYARSTPFYEHLLFSMCADRRGVAEDIVRAQEEVVAQLTTHERAISEDSPIRGVADVLLPPDSRRREMVKGAVRRLRGRS